MLDTMARGLVSAGHDVLLYTTADSISPVRRGWVFDAATGMSTFSPATELRHVPAAYDMHIRTVEVSAPLLHRQGRRLGSPAYQPRMTAWRGGS